MDELNPDEKSDSKIPLNVPGAQDGVEQAANKTESGFTSTESVTENGKARIGFRNKLFRQACFSFALFTGGWALGQKGPAFPYFLQMTETDTGEGSMFIISGSIGLMIGSLSAGIAIEKIGFEAVLILAGVITGTTTIVMPWCSVYWGLIVDNLVQGCGFGMTATGTLAECTKIWKGNKRASTFMQIALLCLPWGALVSPLVLSLFLKEDTNQNKVQHQGINGTNQSIYHNETTPSRTYAAEDLYIPFVMSGVLSFLFTPPFAVMLCNSLRHRSKQNVTTTESETKRNGRAMRRLHKIVALYCVGQAIFFVNIVFNCITQFLPYFLVTQLSWEKSKSSNIMSLFWGMHALGRILGVATSGFLRISTQVLINAILLSVALIVLLVGSQNSGITIWIAAALNGLPCLAPCIMSWALQEILPVGGGYASFMVVAAALGGIVGPAFTGVLMEKISIFCMIYVPLVTSFLLIITCVSLYLFVRLKLQRADKPGNKKSDNDFEKSNEEMQEMQELR